MKLLQEARRKLGGCASPRGLLAIAAALALPAGALAAGGENVVLQFNPSDKIYLYVSLAFGFVAILAAIFLGKKVMGSSPGGEEMQRVGLAIKEGALAYLTQQVKLMGVFVVLLGIGIFFLEGSRFGYTIGGFAVVAFIAGVAASYIAGYAGMLMAVNANMRVANAALSSYKRSLEIGFHSGAVAGMVTVGMGLIGATLILLIAGQDAMKLLVGFGFGGSLAALFMRVGGGIFTKAADVGADLVGKVEAGIPEDDPRNPATIADNVGDNVGDCAGMAADVFESYEVTLVAAIVLGAATAAIFDQDTWTKLILFALMARGVGILASIIGVFSVRGSDDVDADPLKAIRKGFYVSAAVALAATFALAYFMMGGTGNGIQTNRLTSLEEYQQERNEKIVAVRDRIAREKNIAPWRVTPKEVAAAGELRDVLDDQPAMAGVSEDMQRTLTVSNALAQATQAESGPTAAVRDLEGFTPLTSAEGTSPALDFTIQKIAKSQKEAEADRAVTDQSANFVTIRDAIKNRTLDLVFMEVEQTTPAAQGQPASSDKFFIGPYNKDFAADFAKAPSQPGIKVLGQVPAQLYSNSAGELAIGVNLPTDQLQNIRSGGQLSLAVKATPKDIAAYIEMMRSNNAAQDPPPQPPTVSVVTASVENTGVPWWTFAVAIAFGILMAFAIELLTDYYVSTHKRPTQEVAGVASAGPAPMIIQGFAYAAESSVFMVFAIVVALLFPLFLFSPMIYGGYLLSFYGIALVGLGLLTTTGYVLAMDTFGPISDNAQGVYEMSGVGHDNEYGSKAVQRLDAAGNTTKALTKGFAIATAVVAAVALFHSYLDSARLSDLGLRLDIPEIFLGLLIGGAAPYLFSATTINAVGRASFQLINEVRRQFRNDPGILAGTSKPDYGRCVAIVTAAAQKELISPGILAIGLPAAVAFGFAIGKDPVMIGGSAYNLTGAQALGGFLAGSIVSGQLMAVLLANSGGMWDNAKKIIEDGLFGGKGTDAHKAAVVCDTVGDPFKDTAGPALNPLIKVMNLVALLLAPVVIQPYSNTVLIIITTICVVALAISIYLSKKGSMSSAMQSATTEAAHTSSLTEGESAAPTTPAPQKKRITVEDDDTTS